MSAKQLGTYLEDTVNLNTKFNTSTLAGAPITLAGTPVVSVYKANATTTESVAGVTLSVDHDGVTGMHNVLIDLSSDAFYAVGEDYQIVVTTGTVDGQTIAGKVVAEFNIEHRFDEVDVTKIGADATALANFLATYDGTGYVDAKAPATQEAVGAIGGSTAAGFPVEATSDNVLGAIKAITFVGVQTSGTFVSVEAEDGIYHVIDDTGNAIDIVYQFSIGGERLGIDVLFKGFLNSNNDEITVQAYDFIGADWETRGTISGQNGSMNIEQPFTLLSKHTGTSGADSGLVLIRFVNSGQSNPTLQVDELLVTAAALGQSAGYANGRIFINTALSNTNTVAFVDGTADNPVSTIAAALTLSTSTGLTDFHVINGSSIVLAAVATNFSFFGNNWSLDVNGQSLAGAHIEGAILSGSSVGSGHRCKDCRLGVTTFEAGTFVGCELDGKLTVSATGNYLFDGCSSIKAATAAPIIDMGAAIGASFINMRHYSGGIEFENFKAGDLASVEGDGQLIINANCTGGTISVRGAFEITDNANGAVTIIRIANFEHSAEIEDIRASMFNKLHVNDTLKQLELFNAAGTAVLFKWALLDESGAAISVTVGEIARRGVETAGP